MTFGIHNRIQANEVMCEIIIYPDARLSEKSDDVTRFGAKLANLVVGMKRLLVAKGGYGLAAPQVGEKKRVIVITRGNSRLPLALINPRLVESAGKKTGTEGCLSIPDVWLPVARPEKAVIKAQDISGDEFDFTADETDARVALHEIDHLNGILLWDRLPDDEKKEAINSYLEKRRQAADGKSERK